MVDLVLLGALTLVAAGAGKRLLTWCRIGGIAPLEEFVFAAALGLGTLSYVVFGLGMTGLLRRGPMLAALAVIAALCHREVWTLARRLHPRSLRAFFGSGRHGVWGWLLIVIVVVTALVNVVGALAPISSADALQYHARAAKHYVGQERMVPLPWEWRSYQPFNIEMLFLLGLLVRGDTLGALTDYLFGLLILLAIAAFCRRHVPSAHAPLAAAIFYVGGLLAWVSTSSFIDLGLTLFAFLAVMAVVNWSVDRHDRWLLVGGILAGLAAGSKLTGPVSGVILTLMLLTLWRFERSVSLRSVALFATPVVLLTLPWYVRTYVWTGNPLYPFLPHLFGTEDLDGPIFSAAARYGYGKGLLALLLAPFNLTARGRAFDLGELISPLYLCFVPVSFLLTRDRRVLRWVWVFAGLYFLAWFYIHQHTRYLLPILPPLAVVSSAAAIALMRLGGALRLATVSAIVATLGFGFAVTVYYNAQFFPVVFGFESRHDFLARKTWFYEDVRWMNDHLPADARVLVINDPGFYYLERRNEGYNGSLASVLAVDAQRRTFDYVFCAGDCRVDVPGVDVVRRSRNAQVRSRTFGDTAGDVPAYVLRVTGGG